MSGKLTNRQCEALIKLRDHGPQSAYPGLYLGTLNALSLKGLVAAKHRLGSMAMPHTSIEWSITDAGREALREHS
jgi:hypothetical protein